MKKRRPIAVIAFLLAAALLSSQLTYADTGLFSGYTQVEKVYALVNAPSFLNVRERADKKSRIVGILHPGDFCYILYGEGQERVYIESNELRGFVDGKWLLTGDAIASYGKISAITGKVSEGIVIVAPEDNKAVSYTLTTTRDLSEESTGTAAEESAAAARNALASENTGSAKTQTPSKNVSQAAVTDNSADAESESVEIAEESTASSESVTGTAPAQGTESTLSADSTANAVSAESADSTASEAPAGNAQNAAATESTAGNTGAGEDPENEESVSAAASVSAVTVGSSDNYKYALDAASVKVLGLAAAAGDEAAREEILQLLADAAETEWNRYGYLKSVVIAQVVDETEWLTFPDMGGDLRPADNNVLGIPVDFLTGYWASNWSGTSAIRTLLGEETEVRIYESVDACLMDYAAFMVGIHPELARELNVETVLLAALGSGGEHTAYTQRIASLIEKFELTRFDPEPEPEEPEVPRARIDERTYSAGELELIWALVAQEDDTSYEGALAVITSVMNRADMNYGGYGTSALVQLTAPGQFCYSPEISPAYVWNWRMGGNVADFVKAAVNDCLNGGVRNHGYINFRSYNGGGWVRIGTNYYF